MRGGRAVVARRRSTGAARGEAARAGGQALLRARCLVLLRLGAEDLALGRQHRARPTAVSLDLLEVVVGLDHQGGHLRCKGYRLAIREVT